MKQVQEKSKQTVWILTMLTVMVVLSVYYLVSDPYVSTDLVTQEDQIDLTADISTEDVTDSDLMDQFSSSNSDFLIGLKMERYQNRSKLFDQYYAMMQSEISEEAILNIQEKIEDLQSIEEAELVLEQLIIADGFEDAVVLTNGNNVDVIVQTEAMTQNQAVKIIKMVSDRLDVPAVNVNIKKVPDEK